MVQQVPQGSSRRLARSRRDCCRVTRNSTHKCILGTSRGEPRLRTDRHSMVVDRDSFGSSRALTERGVRWQPLPAWPFIPTRIRKRGRHFASFAWEQTPGSRQASTFQSVIAGDSGNSSAKILGCKPYAIQRRAHWCAPPHVSIATTVPAGTCANHSPNASRLSSCRDCTRPVALIVQTETQTSPNPRQWL